MGWSELMSGCTKILRPGLEWSVGQIKGRPFNVQAKGGHWPTRAFYAECAQVGAGRKVRNADFILIAAKRRYLTLSVSEHNPSTQPATVRRAPFYFAAKRPPQPSARRAVKPKNPPAIGWSILRTFCAQKAPNPMNPLNLQRQKRCPMAATTTLSGEAAVKPKNPWARRAHQS